MNHDSIIARLASSYLPLSQITPMSWPTFNASDFPKTTPEEWRQKALQDLKGKTLESLVWDSELGEVPPIFHPEDEIEENELPARSASSVNNAWEIAQTFTSQNSNKEMIDSLMQGLSYLTLIIHKGEEGRIHDLLKGVHVEMVFLKFKGDFETKVLVEELVSYCNHSSQDISQMRGCLGSDHFSEAFNAGTISIEEVTQRIEEQIQSVKQCMPKMRCLPIHAASYFEAGANDIVELAMAIKLGQLSLETALNGGLSVDEASALLEFEIASSPSYFIAIAKFRALRSMWASVIESYSPEHACSSVIWIEGVTSERYFATNDHKNNLLRSTTEAMSAIIGSCDSLNVSPCSKGSFDADEARWARNIQHLLREEGWLDAVIDPGNGSYYIEELTVKFIKQVSQQLKSWESSGEFHSEEVRENIIAHISSNRKALLDDAIAERRIIVGVNKFQPTEKLREKGTQKASQLASFNVPFALDQLEAL